ncbi:MAG: hypothetical protein HOV87_16560 [Catenulispora sp.]|nr:hypothetical protein [Catenulispora sp.]
MATRITATAAAISLAGAAWALHAAPSAQAAAAAAAPAVAAPAAAPALEPSGSIPFSVADPETSPRPVVTVTIGGVPLLLLLDTGSTGIRISADRVPAQAVTVTGAAAPYGYGSGVRLHGDRADTDVTLGGYHTGPLPIELVRSTDCFPDRPGCPAAHGAKPAMFGGVLDGVMGVSLEAATGLVNPMWALRDGAGNHVGRQFAVRFVPDQFSGEILLNVPAAGYGLVQLPKSPVAKIKHTHNAAPQVGWSQTFTSGPGTEVTVSDTASADTGGSLLGLPAFAKGPIRFDLAAGTVGFPAPDVPPAPLGRALVQSAPVPAQHAVPPQAAVAQSAPQAAAPSQPVPKQSAPNTSKPSGPQLPFHKTAKKAARLPDTGVPMSAALGAVTALTALLAGIGTVLAARRRPDREA